LDKVVVDLPELPIVLKNEDWKFVMDEIENVRLA
jgi:hypothetical protein